MMSQNDDSITWYPSLYAIKTTSNVWCHKMMTVLLDIPACMPLKPPQMYDVTKWWQYYLISQPVKKWNESGFRPPLCTYRLNWARRTSWGWWDDWDDTVLQTQDSKFEPWRSEAEHATSRSRRLPTILTFTRGWGRNIFVSLKPPRPGTEPRTLAWKAAVLTTTLGPPPPSLYAIKTTSNVWCHQMMTV